MTPCRLNGAHHCNGEPRCYTTQASGRPTKKLDTVLALIRHNVAAGDPQREVLLTFIQTAPPKKEG